MFERYTQKARRVIFHSRYEVSQCGVSEIETQFLLLGLLREDEEMGRRWLGVGFSEIRDYIASVTKPARQIPTSVDLPLSDESKRVLAHASEEAERLGHSYIGTEHLLLGLLREPNTLAARKLKARGTSIDTVRAAVAAEPQNPDGSPTLPPVRTARIQMVTEAGEQLAVIEWGVRAPAIGEAVIIPDWEGKESRWRILDLSWRLQRVESATLRAGECVLKVRRENS